MQIKGSNHFWRILFYVVWTAFALLLSGSAELIDDEAYYWVCSRHLDVGYFFQPPMSAWMIGLGTLISDSEWGVRLLFTLMSTGSLMIVERIIKPLNFQWFVMLILSVALLHIGGVMAVPDIPLFFFAALWIWRLRTYLEKPSLIGAIALGIIAALLMYSKYHSLMLLGLCLLPNLKLFKEWTFYVLLAVTFVLLIPHVQWVVNMEFQPIKFHLFDRGPRGFNSSNVLFFIGGQILLFGPLVGPLLFAGSITETTKDVFERTLKYCFYGILGFLLLLSLRGQVEANWSVIALIPMLYFTYRRIETNAIYKRWLRILFIPSLSLVICARLFVMFDGIPTRFGFDPEFVGSKEWATDMANLADNRPIVFMSSYQDASKYQYYSGQPAYSLGISGGHGSDYDNWVEEHKRLQGQDVLFVLRWEPSWADSVKAGSRMMYTKSISNFRSYANIDFSCETEKASMVMGERNTVQIKIDKDAEIPKFNANDEYTPYWCFTWSQGGQIVERHKSWVSVEHVWKSGAFDLPVILPSYAGEYTLDIGIQTAWIPPYVRQVQLEVVVE